MIVYTTKHHIPFQIDEDQFDKVVFLPWCICKGYVVTRSHLVSMRLPNYLFGYPTNDLQWDHINRDKLDNRKINLRHATALQNSHNRNLYSNNQTGCPGVYHSYSRIYEDIWIAQIMVHGKRINLGTHKSLEAAILARQEGEKKYWGDPQPSVVSLD